MNRNRKITVQWCDQLPQNGQNYLVIDEVCLNRLQHGKKNWSNFFEVPTFSSSKWAITDHNLFLSQELVDFTLLAS